MDYLCCFVYIYSDQVNYGNLNQLLTFKEKNHEEKFTKGFKRSGI